MTIDVHELPWPIGGLNERLSLEKQPPLSTREEQNVRSLSPVTERLTGGPRPGQSAVGTAALGAAPVRALACLQKVNNRVDFAAISNPNNTKEWELALQSQGPVYDLKVDARGNIYALDGSTAWALVSADGKASLHVPIPLDDRRGVVRTLCISEERSVFVAVGEGGDHRRAIIAGYVPGLSVDSQLVYDHQWTITPQRFVTHMAYRDGRLYTLQDDPEYQRATCVIYEQLTSVRPTVFRVFPVPYPSRGIAVDENGQVFTTHPPFTNRGLVPNQDAKNDNVGFDIDDYEANGDIKVWAHLRADRIVADDLSGDPSDPRCDIFRDVSRFGIRRNLYVDTVNLKKGPHYRARGPLVGKPALWFDGIDNVMTTLANPGVTAGFADQQLSLFPSYQGAAFALFMVVTPEPEATVRTLISQIQENTLAQVNQTAFERCVLINRADAALPLPGAAVKGVISIAEDALSGFAGTAGSDIEAQSFDTRQHSLAGGAALKPAAGLLTYICDGGFSLQGGGESSLFRWNGCPVDQWNARPIESSKGTLLGFSVAAGASHYKGYVHEILVLDLRDRANPTTAALFSDHTTGTAYDYPTTAWSSTSDTILEQIEGVLMRRWGLGHLLDNGSVDGAASLYRRGNDGGDPDSTFIHPYGDGSTARRKGQVPWVDSNGPGPGATAADPNQLLFTSAITCKWEGTHLNLAAAITTVGGHGYGIVMFPRHIDSPDAPQHLILCCGPPVANDADVRSFSDNGTVLQSAGSEVFATAYDLADQFPRLGADHFGKSYIPVVSTSAALGATVAIFKPGGIGGMDPVLEYLSHSTVGSSFPAHCVAPSVGSPKYPVAQVSVDNARAEFMYIGLKATEIDGVGTTTLCLRKVRLISVTPNTLPPRSHTWLGACNGNIVKFADGVGPVTPTGGSGALDAASRFVTAATLFGKAFFTDGSKYAYYDQDLDTVQPFAAKRGVIPVRLQVFELWRGRLVGFGDPTNQWWMSAKDDPFDWDDKPPVETARAAINGARADMAGLMAEPLNAFIPLNNDLALMGTTSSIYQLSGDPRESGAALDVVNSKYGIAFGRAWTRDSEENVYVMLTTGQIAAFDGRGTMLSISQDKIPARLKNINRTTHYVLLEWSWEQNGLHVFVVPFAGYAGVQGTHYFWEKSLDAWHPDVFAIGKQPTSTIQLQGDVAADQRVVVGGEDGWVRRFDPAVFSDDGTAIDAYTTIGPLAPGGARSPFRYRFTRFMVQLKESEGGAMMELYGSDSPDSIGRLFHTTRLHPGRNVYLGRVNAAYCYVRLRSALAGVRFTYEGGQYWSAPAGRLRELQS